MTTSIDRLYGELLTQAALTVPDWDCFGAEVSVSADYAEPFGAFFISEARTMARYRDTLTVGGGSGSGRVRFPWHVEGATRSSGRGARTSTWSRLA